MDLEQKSTVRIKRIANNFWRRYENKSLGTAVPCSYSK